MYEIKRGVHNVNFDSVPNKIFFYDKKTQLKVFLESLSSLCVFLAVCILHSTHSSGMTCTKIKLCMTYIPQTVQTNCTHTHTHIHSSASYICIYYLERTKSTNKYLGAVKINWINWTVFFVCVSLSFPIAHWASFSISRIYKMHLHLGFK